MHVQDHQISTAEGFLFSVRFPWEGRSYVVDIYHDPAKKARCSHSAETVLGPGDTIISDGRSPEEVLYRQQTILPLAILSRSLL
jgi:hypothetical protein